MLGFAAIDVGALVEVVWVSLLIGVGLTAVFCAALYGATRFVELRRGGHTGQAVPFAVLAGFSFAVIVAAAVAGFIVMVSK